MIHLQISYTLDILLFIGCMLDRNDARYDEDIEQFLPMLGTVSDKHLKKLQKTMAKNPEAIYCIISMIIDNDHLHTWTTLDLLDRPKRIISMFKKSPYYTKATRDLKYFMKTDFPSVLGHLKILTADLERLGFKQFWLKKHLPILKRTAALFDAKLASFNIIHHINNWITLDDLSLNAHWYITAYHNEHFKALLKSFNLISSTTTVDDLFEQIVIYGLKEQSYLKWSKQLKKDPTLKQTFNDHEDYKHYRNINEYIETSLKMALKTHIMNHIPGFEDVFVLPENYLLAEKMLHYLELERKTDQEPLKDYIINMMNALSLQK